MRLLCYYNDIVTMLENRKSPRFSAMSHAKIPGIMDGNNLLMDISITGCRVKCKSTPNVKNGSKYQIDIDPEKVSHISSFQLQVECKWIQTIGGLTELGFNILASPKGKQFQNYVDFLEYISRHPT